MLFALLVCVCVHLCLLSTYQVEFCVLELISLETIQL